MKVIHSSNEHDVKAVEVSKIANGALSIRLRCCDNPETDHWHTLYAVHGLDSTTIDVKLAEVGRQVADQHASMEAAHKYITENLLSPSSSSEPPASMTHLK